MGRLSNYTREEMATALVKHRFADRAAALVAESQELFRLLYDFHHDADTRKHMAAIQKKHGEGFGQRNNLTANVMGRKVEVGHRSIAKYWRAEMAGRAVLSDAKGYSGIGVDSDTPLASRLIVFADAEEAMRGEINPAYREAMGALAQFTTAKRLAEDWPEAMPVIGSLIPEDDRALPVVQVAGLNAKFDLPPADRMAA